MGPIGGGLPMGATAHVDWLRMTLIQKQCHFTQNLRGEHLRERLGSDILDINRE
jgi:hypothetical protein